MVSIHAPAWGATVDDRLRAGRIRVSIHAPAWGATRSGERAETAVLFQFTRPRGARPPGRRRRRAARCFNSRARVGRDVVGRHDGAVSVVSIHAPAWGATHDDKPALWKCRVSIHAPAWGATPMLCAGGDPVRVSIHAPAWGATPARRRAGRWRSFNSRARVGRDANERRNDRGRRAFQFTRPRGARRRSRTNETKRFGFNSRARVGRDESRSSNSIPIFTFQFTRPRGARPLRAASRSRYGAFQFTRPRGARPETLILTMMGFPLFQFTRPRGARPATAQNSSSPMRFQFTRPRGARQDLVGYIAEADTFQFTRPRGARPGHGGSGFEKHIVSIHAPAWGATCP